MTKTVQAFQQRPVFFDNLFILEDNEEECNSLQKEELFHET